MILKILIGYPGWIRTGEMMGSEPIALPLGDRVMSFNKYYNVDKQKSTGATLGNMVSIKREKEYREVLQRKNRKFIFYEFLFVLISKYMF